MTNEEIRLLTLHVAADGCDGWSGTLAIPNADGTDGPLATLAAARDRLRAIRAADKLRGPAEVLVHTGRYELTQTLTFGPEDLGDEGTPVTYRAAGDGEARLTGGARLQGWVPCADGVYKLELAAAGHAGLRFRQLFCAGIRQRLARYPNYDPQNPYGGGWLYVEGTPPNIYEEGHGEKERFICRDPRLKNWSRIGEVELFIYPRYNWTNNLIRLASYDPQIGEVRLTEPASYAIYPGDRFYFQNAREELDAPGEWYLDGERDTLYFYPPEPPEQAVIEAAQVKHLIVVDGTPPEPDLLADGSWEGQWQETRLLQDPAKVTRGYLTFEGFTIENCDGVAVILRNARACRVRGCTVRNTGLAGVEVRGGAACQVSDCDVSETGHEGIKLLGGRRLPFAGAYLACGHEAVNNYVHHVGIFYKQVPAIALTGIGIRMAHNLIHDGPRWGIFPRGNDNLIEYNHIRHVNIETSDTSAIDMCDRDFSMRGTIIRYNRIHDVLGYHRVDGKWRSPAYAFGIYLDDWTSGVEVRGNLTYRTVRGGMYVHAGQDIIVENNMFLESTEEMAYFRRWEADRELRHCGTHNQGLRRNIFRRNIVATRIPQAHVYAFSNSLDGGGNLDIDTNAWAGNLVWHYGAPLTVSVQQRGGPAQALGWADWQAMGHDEGSLVEDPLFIDIDAENFALREDSPAYKLGFEPLPFEQMGPQPSPLRKEWPIREAEGAREHPLIPDENN